MMNLNDSLSENEYFVEKVLGKKVEEGEVRYLIKWEGWSMDQSTWEPLENLGNINHLIEEFEREDSKEKEKKRKVGRPSLKEYQKKQFDMEEISKEREINNSEKVFSVKPKESLINHTKEISHPMEKSTIDNEYVELLRVNVPDEVTGVKKDKNNAILCMVKFKERPDGLQKENTYVPSNVLKEMCPKVLIKFYESKIKFIDK